MKAENVVVLHVGAVSPITEYMVIASGDNARHVKALAQETVLALKADGVPPVASDGFEEGRWAVVDYGPLMIHVFQHDARQFYDLEMLWGDGKKVRWKAPKARAKDGE